jgi:hypothetical protein
MIDFQAGHDFVAGVKSKLIDKSSAPVEWSPAKLTDVTSTIVNSYFAPVPAGDIELELPTTYDVQETPAHRTTYMRWNMQPYTPLNSKRGVATDEAPAKNTSANSASSSTAATQN